MFAVCQPEGAGHGPFREGAVLGTALAGPGADANSNFVAGGYDRNENWSRPAPGARSGDAANPSDNLLLLMPRQLGPGGLRGAAQRGDPERLRAAVRSPPEGAEAGGTEEAAEPPGSPEEDNGYGSSSLSIESPASGGDGAREPPAAARGRKSPAEPEPEPCPGADTLFPALAEAFQHIQDKERFKEREKEKHHVQLVMYRRLALLRWIHGLQQKVVEQQNRLQESFDTILDNRKELIRCMQQG
ncbi:CA216 protein, partial [Nothoprocta ornata]|nr:CA216 protein [Nothoprocta ornata]